MFPLFVFGGGAINFDGTDDYVTLSSVDDYTDEITFNLWFNPQGDSATQKSRPLLSKRTGANIDYQITYVKVYAFADYNKIRLNYGGTSIQQASSSTDLSSLDDSWISLFITLDGANVRFYINGELDSSESQTAPLSSSVLGNYIGLDRATGTSYYSGLMGECIIYNVVLSGEEIKAMYASRNAWYPKTGLVSRWSMGNNGINTGQSHPNGSTVKDSAGSNDGTINDGSDASMTLESSPTRKKRGRR